ncbi:hypothetical protein BZZ01_15220 [Nostocales cyanobacterium HT-58-2]|nr:hypothetical protein BZZ01_15220 [Nostocales cyanobacterium HT-58-2]
MSLSFATDQLASIVTESEPNNSFATRQFLPFGTSTVDGELSSGDLDFLTFSGLAPGSLFTVQVNSQSFDPLLGWLDDSGNIQAINDDQSDNNVLPTLTGIIPESGSLNLAVSVTRDIELTGEHFQSGAYTLSLEEFLLPTPSINSTFINGDFETGDWTGWTTLGSTSLETAVFGSGPTKGTFQSLLSTGGAKFDDSILEKFLGLNAESLNNLGKGNATGGSAIQQTFTAKAGDILTFDWNLLTNEVLPPVSYPDFAFVSINSQSDDSISFLSELADASTATSTISSTQFFGETNFHTFSFTIPTTGIYTLGVGVTDVGDTTINSGLLVDNITLNSVDVLPFGTEANTYYF